MIFSFKYLNRMVFTGMLFVSPFTVYGETIIARVGKKNITLEEIQKFISSTPYGSLSLEDLKKHPHLPYLLKDLIHAELLYLDAVRSGINQRRDFKKKMDDYETNLLADLYREQFYKNNLKISSAEISNLQKKEGLSKEAARALLSSGRKKSLFEAEKKRLFQNYNVQILYTGTKNADSMSSNDILARGKNFTVLFSEIKDDLADFGRDPESIRKLTEQIAMNHCMASESRKRNYQNAAVILKNINEYEKSQLINYNRNDLKKRLYPSGKDIQAYIRENDFIQYHPREVSVLLIVTATEEEAKKVINLADSGQSFYELAARYSILPNAKIDTGKVPPFKIGEGPYNAIDRILMYLDPGELSQPVKGERGYSIFKMLSISEKIQKSDEEIYNEAKNACFFQNLEAYLEGIAKNYNVKIFSISNTEI